MYSTRRPFHPKRLWDLLQEPFCILQNADGEEDEEDDEEEDEDDQDENETDDKADTAEPETKAEILARLQAEKEALDLPSRIAFKRASPIWKGILRSKGFVWLATRPSVSGEWSQAGCMFTLAAGSPWMCCVDESEWPTDDPEVVSAIKQDFMGPWGDRRQEVVFIGQSMNQELLEVALGKVMLDDDEMKQWEGVMNSGKSLVEIEEKLFELFDGELESCGWS